MTLFRSLRLFDGTGDDAVPDSWIHVVGGLVRATGQGEPVGIVDAEVVDLGGRVVMPGLIDAHTHLEFPSRGPGEYPLSIAESAAWTALRTAHNALVYLASGVTSVMDCGCRANVAVALRDAVERGLCRGPRVIASGQPLSPTGGWADEHAPFLHNEIPDGTVADTPDEWLREVRRQVKEGVDNIKIGISGSAVAPWSDPLATDMSAELVAFVVEAAHRAGCSVAAHCGPAPSIRVALAGGVDTVHHGSRMDDETIEMLRASSAYLVPTAMKIHALATEGLAAGRPPEAVASFQRSWEEMRGTLARLVAAGLADSIAVGSDAGNRPPLHGTTAREIGLLVEAGMTPAQALRSGTSVAAAAIGLRGQVGELVAGQAADLLVVDGDPLADVAILTDRRRIAAVYQAGVLVAAEGVLVGQPDLDLPVGGRPVVGRRSNFRMEGDQVVPRRELPGRPLQR